MSLPTLPFTTVWTRIRAFFRTSFNGLPMGIKQFLGQTARAVALAVWGLQGALDDLDLDIVPSAKSSDAILSAWAFLLGLPNGQGGYGRLLATAASGGAATFTGAAGTSYADGTIATAEDGTTQIKVSGTVAIPAGTGLGSIAGKLVAVTTGSVGNLPAGTVCTWLNPPAGADPTFTLTTGLTNGTDIESNAHVWTRIEQRLQVPPRGGNSTDIADWADGEAGVVGVFCYPRRSGTGTVDVVITVGGSGTSRAPSNSFISAVQALIDAARVPGAESISAYAPYTAASGHAIRVRVSPNGTANAFDWGSDVTWTGTPYTVASYAAGTPAKLTLNVAAPASLQAAIAAYKANTGTAPRLQVLSTGAAAVNPSVTVVDIDNTNTVLTLGTLPSTWTAPTGGDVVFPYGPVVGTIATNLLALVDELGPSRASGYGDTYNIWQDTLSINQIVRIAEDAVDGSGTALVLEVIAGGATIDGVAADVEPGDSVVGQAPELAYAKSIAVTP